ncbi:major facilitator superfamily domain-containing protein [Aspergillus germanicus]
MEREQSTDEESVYHNAEESDVLINRPGELPATRRSLLLALPALLLCQFVIRFDGSYMIGNYSRRIALDLHEFQNARWLVLGFLVTESSCAPLYGHVAQIHGQRRAILFAAALICVGFLFCSVSHRLWQVALSRVVVGTDFVQLYELPLWTSATVTCGTIGLMLGGPAGAALTDILGFRPTFGIEAAVMWITLIVLFLTLRSPTAQAKSSAHAPRKIEYTSSGLLLLTVAVPLFALNLGGEVIAWSDPVVILLFLSTPVLISLFYYIETHIATSPIVPKRLVQNKNVAIALACTLPMKFAFDQIPRQLRFSFGTYLAAQSFGHESSFNDWALTFIYFGRSLGTLMSGLLVRRYRKFKRFLQVDIVIDIVIYACFALGLMHPEQPSFSPVLVLIGATEGFAEGLWLVAMLSLVEVHDQPVLYAFFNLALAVSGDIGIAISLAAEGTLVRSKLNASLGGNGNADEIIRKSLEDLNYVRELPSNIQRLILKALESSTEAAFGISFSVLLVSLAFSFYVKEMARRSRGVSYVS